MNPSRQGPDYLGMAIDYLTKSNPRKNADSNSALPSKNPFRPRNGGPRRNNTGTKGPVVLYNAGNSNKVKSARVVPRRQSKMSIADIVGVGPLKASFGGNQSFSAAVSYGKQSKMLAPQVTGRSANTIRIKHRELVEPALLGSTTFALQESYVINPGLSSAFPWLSTQAGAWQEYELHSLAYVYLTRVSTATSGSIMISPDLDPSNPPPSSEVATSNNPSTVEGPVWHDLRCNVDLKGSRNVARRFVRSGPEVGDLHLFDALAVYIITSDCANTNPIGKVWVEYDISFYLPVVGATDPISRGCSFFTNSGDQACVNGVPTAVLFQTEVCNPFGIQYASGVFTPPRGMYIVNAILDLYDGTANHSCQVTIYKNGAPARSDVSHILQCGIGNRMVVPSTICISCNGTDTLSVMVTANTATCQMDGSAGTFCTLQFTLC